MACVAARCGLVYPVCKIEYIWGRQKECWQGENKEGGLGVFKGFLQVFFFKDPFNGVLWGGLMGVKWGC